MKDCFDMVIYQQLLWDVKPRTIFETGAYTGACALWMGDTMKQFNMPVHIYSMDIDTSLVDPLVHQDDQVTVIEESVLNINQVFDENFLKVIMFFVFRFNVVVNLSGYTVNPNRF